MKPITIRSRRVVFPDGERAAAIRAEDGVIRAISAWDDGAATGDTPTVDCGTLALLPGLVDAHVHVNEPGRTEWEGFPTASRAAAAGGVTTVCDMPLNAIPATIDASALAAKRAAAEGRVHVDVAFIGGVVPESLADGGRALRELASGGVVAFKCFLCPSGVDEFTALSASELDAAVAASGPLGLPLFAHCEDPGEVAAATTRAAHLDRTTYARHAASRPPAAERKAIERLIAAASAHDARVHVVHLADGGSVPALRAARSRGVAVTTETCPHYLVFDDARIVDGAVEFQSVPLRSVMPATVMRCGRLFARVRSI